MKSVIGKSLALGLLVGAAAIAACSTHNPGPGSSTGGGAPGTVSPSNVDGTGTVGFQYTLPGGQQINTVNYTLTNGTNTYTGSVNVADAGTISFVIGGVAAGSGYSIVLSALTTDGKDTCNGAVGATVDGGLTLAQNGPPFSVANRATTTVNVQMVCFDIANLGQGAVLVNGFTNCCATWDTAVMNPSGTLNTSAPGNTTLLSANASGPCSSQDGGQLVNCTWTVAGTGTVGPTTTDGAGNFVATYTCATGSGATDTLNLDCTDGPLPDGGACPSWSTHYSQTVTCGVPAPCTLPGESGVAASPNTAAGACTIGGQPAHNVGTADSNGNFCCVTAASFCGSAPVATTFPSGTGGCTGGLVNNGQGCCVSCQPPGGDQPGCNAYVTANAAANGNSSGNVCTNTEDVIFQVDGTGACLGCMFQSGCLDLTATSNTFECEDPITNGNESECLTTLECAMAVPTTSCAVAGTAPAKGQTLNAYCGAETVSVCTTPPGVPIGTCNTQEAAGFPGLMASGIVSNFGNKAYASGRANAIMNCGHTNCAASCGL